jgi:hypothetical protein
LLVQFSGKNPTQKPKNTEFKRLMTRTQMQAWPNIPPAEKLKHSTGLTSNSTDGGMPRVNARKIFVDKGNSYGFNPFTFSFSWHLNTSLNHLTRWKKTDV